jgi:hypothetical protein
MCACSKDEWALLSQVDEKSSKGSQKKVNKWKQYRETGSYNDLVEYKLARKLAERQYRKAKRVFEEKVANEVKSNPKSFYAYVRSNTSVKEEVGPRRDRYGKLVMDSEGMVIH